MAKKLVIANWKMHVERPEAAKRLAVGLRKRARTYQGTSVWLAPSYPLIPLVVERTKGSHIQVGAQAVSPYTSAQGEAHTGEVSAATLKNVGGSFALVGHSERRQYESSALVHAQVVHTARAGLWVVLCVGEHERTPDGAHFSYIEEQLASALRGAESVAGRLIVAYEPVWAIGKSSLQAMQPQELEETVIFIRKTLAQILGRKPAERVPILYGGSVDQDNAPGLLQSGVAGLLLGRAGTDVDSLVEILKICKG